MKKKFTKIWMGISIVFISSTSIAQTTFFTWMKGSNSTGAPASYGVRGVEAVGNSPGPRQMGASWTDLNGNIWIFGGSGNTGDLNDLWKFNPSTKNWTWMSGSNLPNQYGVYGTIGSSSSLNTPGARTNALSWTDSNGNLWLMGGYGYQVTTSQYLNDLWMYNIASNEWTWVSGSNFGSPSSNYGALGVAASSNHPGAVENGICWSANNQLWFFGGFIRSSSGSISRSNTLWRYDISSGLWTWMGGSNTNDVAGVYGIQGIASTSNIPGSREKSVSWVDNNGNFWLMGGHGNSSSVGNGFLNDLWKYNTTTNEWTWVSGSNTINQLGSFGVKGQASSSNLPTALSSALGWTDSNNNLWMFGGNLMGSISNAVWRYNTSSNQWTWMAGNNTSVTGNYGTMGVTTNTNYPGSRINFMGGKDNVGDYWIFGGYTNFTPFPQVSNDVWNFSVCETPANPVNTTSITSVCSNEQINLTVNSSDYVTWHSTPTTPIVLRSGNTYTTSVLNTGTTSATYTVYAMASVGCGSFSDRIAITFTVKPTPQPTINPIPIMCPNSDDTLTTQLFDSYTWSKQMYGTSTYTVIPGATTQTLAIDQYSGSTHYYKVEVTQNGCTGESEEIFVDSWAFSPISVISDGLFNVDPNNGNVLLCAGDSVSLIVNMPYDTLFSWKKNSVLINGTTDDDTLVIYNSGIYEVSASPNVCPNFVAHSLPLVVVVNPLPTPSITPIPNMCPYSIDTLVTQNYDSYLWSKRMYGTTTNTFIPGATTSTLAIDQYSGSTHYYKVKVSQNGCTAESEEIFVDSWAFLPISVMIDGEYDVNPENGNIMLCPGDSVSLTVNMTYDTLFTWKNNGIVFNGTADANSITTYSLGTYEVTASPTQCPNYIEASLPIVIEQCATASIDEKSGNNFISIYPNPSNGIFNVVIDNAHTLNTIQITNSLGEIIHQIQSIGIQNQTIDLSKYSDGIYFIKNINSNNQHSINKIIITK